MAQLHAGIKDHSAMQNIPVTASRLQNVMQDVVDDICAGNTQVSQASMAQTDLLFAMETLLEYVKQRAVNGSTQEKNRQLRRLYSKAQFLSRLEEEGGVYSAAEAAKILGKTKTTIRNWKECGYLLALNIDDEFYYPVFQFTDKESNSGRGILNGLAEFLAYLKEMSDRMQYSFFMEKRNTVLQGVLPQGRIFTVAELLKSHPSAEVMQELHRLAKNYATQDAL